MPIGWITSSCRGSQVKLLSHISFPVETLALKSGAPQGDMMPNQYASGGIATVFHTTIKFPRMNESISTIRKRIFLYGSSRVGLWM